LEEGLLVGWKKIWWMVGRRSVGWLDEDLVDARLINGWKKTWSMVGRRSGRRIEEDLLDGWKKI
jgi:hypothetical protein